VTKRALISAITGQEGSYRAELLLDRDYQTYSLAGMSSVGQSWNQAELVADVDAAGVVRLPEASREFAFSTRFCQASSADILGRPVQIPQSESTHIAPVSSYGNSKAYADNESGETRDGRASS